MNCRKCGAKTAVYDSRPNRDGIKRRRQCPKCLHRETSIEVWGIETKSPHDNKPKLVPPPLPKKKTRSTSPRQKVSLGEIANLTDDQVEALIMSGQVKFDEDEL